MANAESRITLETDEVRIREWLLQPGGATDCRRYDCCDRITIFVTCGLLRILGPSGERVIEAMPGAVTLRDALCEDRSTNEGDAAVRFLENELKDTARRLISA
jgi:hypothetical protein